MDETDGDELKDRWMNRDDDELKDRWI